MRQPTGLHRMTSSTLTSGAQPNQPAQASHRDNRSVAQWADPLEGQDFFRFQLPRAGGSSSSRRYSSDASSLLKQGTLQFTDCSSGNFEQQRQLHRGWHFTKVTISPPIWVAPIQSNPRALAIPGLGQHPSVAALGALDSCGYRPRGGELRWPEHIGFSWTSPAQLSTNFTRPRSDHKINAKWRVTRQLHILSD